MNRRFHMSRSHRIKSLISDTDFLSLVSDMEASLTKKVMSPATSPEEREAALAEYHALAKLINRMRSEAQNAKDEE